MNFKKALCGKGRLSVVAFFLLISLALLLLWFSNSNSSQALPSLVADVYFEGRWRIGDGEWHELAEGEHIPSTKGDVTLQGNFHELDPGGGYVGIYRGELPIAFFLDHVSVTVYEVGQEPFVLDTENPLYGDSVCGVRWEAYLLTGESSEPIEIVIHNPHGFGNERAIDEMLSELALWNGMEFENRISDRGEPERSAGMLLMLVSVVFLGIALFSSLIHVKGSRLIWLVGLAVLFAGLYFYYRSQGICFHSGSTISSTTILGIAMMLYMLFLCALISCQIKTMKRTSRITVALLGTANAVFFALPILSEVRFYDTWAWWAAAQLAASIAVGVCLVLEFCALKTKERWLCLGSLLPLLAFAVDLFATRLALWKGGVVSQYVFLLAVLLAAITVLKLIPGNINAAEKARELEMQSIALNAELAESRISTMMSQIRPHFIYNTLGSIEQLCKLNPPKAGELVHSFAKYLRGNFGELDNPRPILFSQEMEHVHHYVSIENVRFPDMTFMFESSSEDFRIPALTVQPIVENAIKHGLMKLPRGGTIRVLSYESEEEYFVSVIDDGVGFDTKTLADERGHVGLRNIRERLRVMVNGTLEIESTVGVGTRVLIRIPKEAGK
ncbi:MAG: histidine kinase [Clostridia bacterium]|nr:histidine kinase [Clostridia bacterium]